MKVSIVIPVYNVEAYIKQCLSSVINQTHDNLEILLVDDCGKDKSIEIAKQMINTCTTEKVFKILKHEYNKGLSAARNTGIREASGEYTFFLDSDDEITEDCIEKMVKEAKKHQPDFVIADYTILGPTGIHPRLNLAGGMIHSNDAIFESFIAQNWYMMAWNKLVKTSFLKANDLYFLEGVVHEDDHWSFILASTANSLFVLKEKTYLYRTREGSITQSPTTANLQSRGEIIVALVNFIKQTPKLKEKPSTFSYIEYLKSAYFYSFVALRASNHERYSFYQIMRQSIYTASPFSFSRNFSLTLLVKNIHYVLPKPIGYQYYQTLLKLNATVRKKINNHSSIVSSVKWQ